MGVGATGGRERPGEGGIGCGPGRGGPPQRGRLVQQQAPREPAGRDGGIGEEGAVGAEGGQAAAAPKRPEFLDDERVEIGGEEVELGCQPIPVETLVSEVGAGGAKAGARNGIDSLDDGAGVGVRVRENGVHVPSEIDPRREAAGRGCLFP